MMPATLACSLSFMLPGLKVDSKYHRSEFFEDFVYKNLLFFLFSIKAATPPNAIAFGSGKLTVFDMIKSGVVANLLGILTINLMMAGWGNWYFDLSNDSYKEWASDTMVCSE